MEPPGLRRAAGCPGLSHSLGARPVCWEPAERTAEHVAEQTSLLEPPRSALAVSRPVAEMLRAGARPRGDGRHRRAVGVSGLQPADVWLASLLCS